MAEVDRNVALLARIISTLLNLSPSSEVRLAGVTASLTITMPLLLSLLPLPPMTSSPYLSPPAKTAVLMSDSLLANMAMEKMNFGVRYSLASCKLKAEAGGDEACLVQRLMMVAKCHSMEWGVM